MAFGGLFVLRKTVQLSLLTGAHPSITMEQTENMRFVPCWRAASYAEAPGALGEEPMAKAEMPHAWPLPPDPFDPARFFQSISTTPPPQSTCDQSLWMGLDWFDASLAWTSTSTLGFDRMLDNANCKSTNEFRTFSGANSGDLDSQSSPSSQPATNTSSQLVSDVYLTYDTSLTPDCEDSGCETDTTELGDERCLLFSASHTGVNLRYHLPPSGFTTLHPLKLSKQGLMPHDMPVIVRDPRYNHLDRFLDQHIDIHHCDPSQSITEGSGESLMDITSSEKAQVEPDLQNKPNYTIATPSALLPPQPPNIGDLTSSLAIYNPPSLEVSPLAWRVGKSVKISTAFCKASQASITEVEPVLTRKGLLSKSLSLKMHFLLHKIRMESRCPSDPNQCHRHTLSFHEVARIFVYKVFTDNGAPMVAMTLALSSGGESVETEKKDNWACRCASIWPESSALTHTSIEATGHPHFASRRHHEGEIYWTFVFSISSFLESLPPTPRSSIFDKIMNGDPYLASITAIDPDWSERRGHYGPAATFGLSGLDALRDRFRVFLMNVLQHVKKYGATQLSLSFNQTLHHSFYFATCRCLDCQLSMVGKAPYSMETLTEDESYSLAKRRSRRTHLPRISFKILADEPDQSSSSSTGLRMRGSVDLDSNERDDEQDGSFDDAMCAPTRSRSAKRRAPRQKRTVTSSPLGFASDESGTESSEDETNRKPTKPRPRAQFPRTTVKRMQPSSTFPEDALAINWEDFAMLSRLNGQEVISRDEISYFVAIAQLGHFGICNYRRHLKLWRSKYGLEAPYGEDGHLAPNMLMEKGKFEAKVAALDTASPHPTDASQLKTVRVALLLSKKRLETVVGHSVAELWSEKV